VRAYEKILILYFSYAAILSFALPAEARLRATTLIVLAMMAALFLLLARLERRTKSRAIAITRDWLPVIVTLLCYREIGWFATGRTLFGLESRFEAWDHWLLATMGGRAVIESLGPLLPGLLELAYLLLYGFGAFGLGMLYGYKARERVDRFWTVTLLGLLFCYVQYPFWPSEPPRTVFPGAESPHVVTIFRSLNQMLVGHYGIHTSVFPSAHVGGATAAALGMLYLLPEHRWVGWSLLVLAFLIAAGAVYGRYHYTADVAAGALMGLLAFGLSVKILWPRIR